MNNKLIINNKFVFLFLTIFLATNLYIYRANYAEKSLTNVKKTHGLGSVILHLFLFFPNISTLPAAFGTLRVKAPNFFPVKQPNCQLLFLLWL